MKLSKTHMVLSGALFAAAFGLTGCSNDSDLPLNGAVVQSPVKDAIVFADKAPYNGILDTGEKKAVGLTDESGRFNIVIPSNYGPYRLVSKGGTDKSGNPGVTMLAPPFEDKGKNSGVISPISSLFALTTDAAKLQKTLGVAADVNPYTTPIPPATLAIMKATESVMSTFNTAVAANPAVATALQVELVKAISSTLTTNNSATSIQSEAAIVSAVTSAASAAIQKVDTDATLGTSLVVTNINALQTAINNSVAAVVAAVNTVASVSSAASISENTATTGTTLNQTFNSTLTSTTNAVEATIIVTPPAPTDTTAPDVAISSKPAASTEDTTATFAFSSSDTTAIFLCKLDSQAFSACTSPKGYSGLAVGNHTFSVKAVDPTGNESLTPASFSWTITSPVSPTGATGGTGGTGVN